MKEGGWQGKGEEESQVKRRKEEGKSEKSEKQNLDLSHISVWSEAEP